MPFVAPARQLVAVKQLKPAVLGDEQELHGFIAETDGGSCYAKSQPLCLLCGPTGQQCVTSLPMQQLPLA